MLQNIPTHVIAGPLGAGKTSLIRQLLAQRPVGERWAVLVNEFGQIGLDAALLSRDDDGITISEVAGGCLCCVNGVPFQVGLGRLLRKARPDRLLIEPSGLGHPAELITQLGQSPWTGVLEVQPLVIVLDALALTAGEALPEPQQEALRMAGMIVINKSVNVDNSSRLLISQTLPSAPLFWTQDGYLDVDNLTRGKYPQPRAGGVDKSSEPVDPGATPTLWINPLEPLCLSQQGNGGWSIGWRWHPSRKFDPAAVDNFLRQREWRRAKMVIHTTDGWRSLNALNDRATTWEPSEWRKDSRIELIFDRLQPQEALQQGLQRCLVA